MKPVYIRSEIAEKIAKSRFMLPEFVMMENAASKLEDIVLQVLKKKLNESAADAGIFHSLNGDESENTDCNDFFDKDCAANLFGPFKVLVLCGSGNNGGDGYALARRLYGKVGFVAVLPFGNPKTHEADGQMNMCQAIGVQQLNSAAINSLEWSVIVDCIYGSGFHGELPLDVARAILWCNEQNAIKIACDIPSGISNNGIVGSVELSSFNAGISRKKQVTFCADITVTMGAGKIALFSDGAKDFVGKIVVADLGINSSVFESCAKPDAFLLDEGDMKLPVRQKKSVHKGNFGHSAVVLGEKPGAGIIAGTAALGFGSGLVTVVDSKIADHNFMMSPELMLGEDFPSGTTAVLIGSGLGRENQLEKQQEVRKENRQESRIDYIDSDFIGTANDVCLKSDAAGVEHCCGRIEQIISKTLDFVENMENPAVVLDADFFYSNDIKAVFEWLNCLKNARVILTPHPKEFARILWQTDCFFDEADGQLKKLAASKNKREVERIFFNSVVDHRFEYGKIFAEKFHNLILVCKGANTFVFRGEESYIFDGGSASLAKAGSGDVLAGMCLSLLAQGYDGIEAAKTAVIAHGKAGSFFKWNFSCTPLDLIQNIFGLIDFEKKC